MSQELSESDLFVLLAKRRRRLTLRILRESAMHITTIEVAKRIGEREYDNPSAEDLHAIHLSLYHNHLPRLEDADVVWYDRDEGIIHPGPNFDSLIRVLEMVGEGDAPWSDENVTN